MQRKSRAEGIDGALTHVTAKGKAVEFDALLLCDRKTPGQQMAAQAGEVHGTILSRQFADYGYLGYPIICIPIGVSACRSNTSLGRKKFWSNGPVRLKIWCAPLMVGGQHLGTRITYRRIFQSKGKLLADIAHGISFSEDCDALGNSDSFQIKMVTSSDIRKHLTKRNDKRSE